MKKIDAPLTSHDKNCRPVIFLMGPTACGKTALAAAMLAALADAHEFELVSVDAAQVYRGMDIGTAKPTREFLSEYPHHLIDIRDPSAVYSAAEFRHDALALINEIHARRKLPILVGGTMFYFAALENGLSELPAANHALRARIDAEMEKQGAAAMHAQLLRVDPKIAATILPSDRQRIQRALEIYELSGRPPSEVMARSQNNRLPFQVIKLGLFTAERAVLHERIAARFRQMLAQGLVEETRAIAKAVTAKLATDIPNPSNLGKQPSMRTVGYRQVLGFLRGEFSHQEMTMRAIAATRQLAKRQLTWMRQQRNLVWIDADHASAHENLNLYLRSRLYENVKII